MPECDLFLFMGQSNMAGRGSTSSRWPQKAPDVPEEAGWEFRAVLDPSRLYPVAEPFGVRENRPGGISEALKTGSLVSAFVNACYARTGVPTLCVSASKGGSSILEWQPGSAYLTDALERLRAARQAFPAICPRTEDGKPRYALRHCFLVWSQGETDGDRGMTAREYQEAFGRMFQELQKNGVEHCLLPCGNGG